jgi:hypothetical protein
MSRTLWVPDSLVGQVGNPKRLSTNTTSTSLNPAGGTRPAQCMVPSTPLQPVESPQVCCTLWVPDSVTSHLIGQVGHGLKLAATISKAHIAVSGPSTEPGATRKATIHGTSEEVGMVLVVMGKRIAQQCVPNPRRKPKPKRPAADMTLRSPTIGRSAPSSSACQDAMQITQAIWPAHDTPSYAPRPSPTPGAWDGEPAAHRRGAIPQHPATITLIPTSTRHWAFQITEDDCRGRKCDPPTAKVYARIVVRLDTELAQTCQAATGGYHARAIEQMDPKPPDGQAAALVTVADTHPERRGGHPPNVTPHQPMPMPGPS